MANEEDNYKDIDVRDRRGEDIRSIIGVRSVTVLTAGSGSGDRSQRKEHRRHQDYAGTKIHELSLTEGELLLLLHDVTKMISKYSMLPDEYHIMSLYSKLVTKFTDELAKDKVHER